MKPFGKWENRLNSRGKNIEKVEKHSESGKTPMRSGKTTQKVGIPLEQSGKKH